MAVDLIKRGKKVLIAGRTESTLKTTSEEIGAAGYYILDTGKTSTISDFITKITTDHPELDCLINNAGVQKPLEVLGPEYSFDLSTADQEIDINIRGPLHLSVGLIQRHFQHLEKGAVVMNVSSGLGFVPFLVNTPVYNGTKAWLHSFTVNLRTQLANVDSKIKIVEVAPPQVETDLHRDRTDPDDNKKKNAPTAQSVDEFMKEVAEGWENDQDMVTTGMGKHVVGVWYENMGKIYEGAIKKK